MNFHPLSALLSTKKERNGTLVLLFIVFLALVTNKALPVIFESQTEFTPEQLLLVEQIEKNLLTQNVVSEKSQKPAPNKKLSKSAWVSTKQEFEKIELNTADTAKLTSLYGIGNKTASSILKYRSILGGYAYPEQLFEVYRIDSLTVMSLLPRFTCNNSLIKKLNINELGLYDLKRHPYISMELSKAIIESRYKNGAYVKLIELQERGLVNAEYYSKIAPYLTCE